jgi:hypothetical protein
VFTRNFLVHDDASGLSVMVADFGLACKVDAQWEPIWIPVRGLGLPEAEPYGLASDVYSFGLILLNECLPLAPQSTVAPGQPFEISNLIAAYQTPRAHPQSFCIRISHKVSYVVCIFLLLRSQTLGTRGISLFKCG